MIDLLRYWADEPPAHVILALRYLGPSARAKRAVTEEQAEQDMNALGGFMGQQARELPASLKQLVATAEELKRSRKGL